MQLIEQAIYTSAQTDRSAGYHVVARSPSVCDDDAREIAVWGPSHDSLLESGAEAVSINFHPLPSGAFCISRTTPSGWEYSGRGGHRVYTQCLIVARETLDRFGGNPFALLRAAMAAGVMRAYDRVPERLEPIILAGRAPAVDHVLLARLGVNPGPAKMAALVQGAMDAQCLAVSGTPSPAALIAGLMSCLPPQCRTEISFSTGLKYCSRRPFRVVAMSDDPAAQRWMAHQNNVLAMHLSADAPTAVLPIQGWARLISRALAAGRPSFLADQFAEQPADLTLEELPALGLQLLEHFDATVFGEHPPHDVPAKRKSIVPGDVGDSATHALEPDGIESSDAANFQQRAHAPHPRFEKSRTAAASPIRVAGPSHELRSDSPEVLARLEYLDDVVYEAIAGVSAALDELQELWPTLKAELGEELLAESRAQYLRFALQVWEACADGPSLREPKHAVQALDVLCVLFDEA